MGTLTAADFAQMVVEDARQRARRDDVELVVRGIMPAVDVDPIGELDEDSLALLAALDELSGEERAKAFNAAAHPRNPKGSPGGGRFRSLVDRIKDAITEHHKSGGKGDPFEGFNREQLRKVAKARGIELKRGEDRDSIVRKLLADLDHHKTAEKAPKTQDVPEFARPFHRDLDGIEDLAASVNDPRPPRSTRILTGGVSAETELVELADGRKVVHKVAGNPNAEQAASIIGRALGLPVPRVYRDEPGGVYMDYVANARTFDEIRAVEHNAGELRAKVVDSDEGRLIGLFDVLIANADRNGGNWMVGADGRVVPIDHGHAFPSMIAGTGRIRPHPIALGPFAERLMQGGGSWVQHDFTQADIQEARRRLEAVRPDLAHFGAERWLDYGLAVLDKLEPLATGKRNLIAGTVTS